MSCTKVLKGKIFSNPFVGLGKTFKPLSTDMVEGELKGGMYSYSFKVKQIFCVSPKIASLKTSQSILM